MCSPKTRPAPCQHILTPSPPARNPASYAHALPGEQSTCGPGARLTRPLHEGGPRSVHSLPQQQLRTPNTASDVHALFHSWSILRYMASSHNHAQVIRQGGTFQDRPELFGTGSLFGTGTALHDFVKWFVPDSGNAITVAQFLLLVFLGHTALFRWEPPRPLMLAAGITTLATLLCSTMPASNSRLTLMPRGMRHPISASTSSVPLGHLLVSALPCLLPQTAYATTPSNGAANSIPDCAHDLSSAIPLDLDLSDDSDASTQVGDHNGDNDADASLDSHTSSQLPDDQSIDSMLDSATSDEVGVVSVEQETESDTSTMSLPSNGDNGEQHHPDDMDDHGDVASSTQHTITANHHGGGASTALTDTIQHQGDLNEPNLGLKRPGCLGTNQLRVLRADLGV